MEYLETPKQTATKNGLTLFKNKDKKPVIIDFSAVEAFFSQNASEFKKIGVNIEEVFASFTAAAVEELENQCFVFSDYTSVYFVVDNYKFYIDFLNERKAVYFDSVRKYNILKPIAARLNTYYLDNPESALYLDFNVFYYKYNFLPIQEINI